MWRGGRARSPPATPASAHGGAARREWLELGRRMGQPSERPCVSLSLNSPGELSVVLAVK